VVCRKEVVTGSPFCKGENAAVGFHVLTTCQPSTVWCSRERLSAAPAQPAKVRQSCSATDLFIYFFSLFYTSFGSGSGVSQSV
jgi:hypothetical protein